MASAGGQLRALNGLQSEALATLPLASMPVRQMVIFEQRRGRSIPLLRRRPRTGLDQAGSTPELRMAIRLVGGGASSRSPG
jgi:hypothetical protein